MAEIGNLWDLVSYVISTTTCIRGHGVAKLQTDIGPVVTNRCETNPGMVSGGGEASTSMYQPSADNKV